MFDTLEAIYGRGLAGMMLVLGTIMKVTGAHAGFTATHTLEGAERWWTDPYSFDQAIKGASLAFRAFTPAGEIALPRVARMRGQPPELNLKSIYENLGDGFARVILDEVASDDSPPERARRFRPYLGETLVGRVRTFLGRPA